MIILINPPAKMDVVEGVFKEIQNNVPPLGLAFVAGYLEYNGYEVKVIDCPVENLNTDGLFNILNKLKSDMLMIGLTATGYSAIYAERVAKRVKDNYPGIPVIIGGPHVTAATEKVLSCGYYDAAVLGEGEITVYELAECFKNNKPVDEVKGIAYLKDGTITIMTEIREYVDDLDSMPSPAWHLMPDFSKYHPLPLSCLRKPFATMFTARGCPYKCTFCNGQVFGRRVRGYSAKRVADEIEHLINDYGIKDIYFHDDEFTYDIGRTHQICDEIKKRRLDITWACNIRADRSDFELLKNMKSAGCWQVLFGLESGNQEILDKVCKHIRLEDGKRSVRIAQEAGMVVRASFMINLPWETPATLKNTLDHALAVKADYSHFNIFVPFPGSKLANEIEVSGELKHKNYEDYSTSPRGSESALPYVAPGITEEQLLDFCKKSYLKLYFNPGYITRVIFKIRTLNDIRRYLLGLKVLLSVQKQL